MKYDECLPHSCFLQGTLLNSSLASGNNLRDILRFRLMCWGLLVRVVCLVSFSASNLRCDAMRCDAMQSGCARKGNKQLSSHRRFFCLCTFQPLPKRVQVQEASAPVVESEPNKSSRFLTTVSERLHGRYRAKATNGQNWGAGKLGCWDTSWEL